MGAHAGCQRASLYATAIANRPLIAHVLDELAAGGITHARLVAPPEVNRDLGRVLAAEGPLGIEVSHADAAASSARQAVLCEVERALSQGDVILHPGDGLFGSGQVGEMRARIEAGDVDSVLPAPADVDPVRRTGQRRASEAIMALGRRTRSLVAEMRALDDEADDLMSVLLVSQCRLAVCAARDHWRYSDTTEVLLEANRLVLDRLQAAPRDGATGENNRIRGQVALSASAFVSNCVIQGPVTIDERAVLEDSFIGPYTAIGPDAILSGAEIDNSMVLAGAEVRHPGSRIEGSILGERSQVVRSFDLPTGLHLRLGPDARLSLS